MSLRRLGRLLMASHLHSRRTLDTILPALTDVARAEVLVALREPQRQLLTVIRNRSEILAREAAEDAVLRQRIEDNDTWGMF